MYLPERRGLRTARPTRPIFGQAVLYSASAVALARLVGDLGETLATLLVVRLAYPRVRPCDWDTVRPSHAAYGW